MSDVEITATLIAQEYCQTFAGEPNGQQSREEFTSQIVNEIVSTGAAFIWEVPHSFGGIAERHVIPTSKIILEMRPGDHYPAGFYTVHQPGHVAITIDARHIKKLTLPILGG